jgi:hypothetical protein
MELAQLVADEAFQAELHHFLWTEPLVNQGMIDLGWSCRDHAAVVGQVAFDAGATVTVLHGKCTFVQGPTADGEPAVGLGQAPNDDAGHSWLGIDDLGHVDLSPKLDLRAAGWRPLRSLGVIASSWRATPNAELFVTPSLTEYEDAIQLAARATAQLHAIYYMAETEPFTYELARDGLSWANSPLTDRLVEFALPADAYVHLARHLVGVARGSRIAVGDRPPQEAWSYVIGPGSPPPDPLTSLM